MKKLILSFIMLGTVSFMQAQLLKKISDRVKNRAESNANNKIDNKTDKTVDDVMNGKIPDSKNHNNGSTSKETTDKVVNSTVSTASVKSYSKFDFVPGEKVTGFEDFSTGSIGDFPARWNTNAAGEIVTIDGKAGRWLKFTKPGEFV
ncbi:MAG: hypothetical protein ABJA57_09150, partial [Ginsengibacter sp.]